MPDKNDYRTRNNTPSKRQPSVSGFSGTQLIKRHLSQLFLSVLVITGLLAGMLLVAENQDPRSEAAYGGVDFEFVPEARSMRVGEEATFALFVFPENEYVTAMDLPLVYDDAVFDLVELKTSSLFDAVTYGPEQVENGVWTSVASVPSGVNEAGEVLMVTLVARAGADNTIVSLASDKTNVAALGRLSTNVLGEVTPAVITVR